MSYNIALSTSSNIAFNIGAKPAIDGGIGFAPSILPTNVLWLDFADTSTIEDTSNDVDQVNDKSGLGNNPTSTGTDRPVTNLNTMNGKNVLAFDGTKRMALPSSLYSTIFEGDSTIFVVSKSASTTDTRLMVATASGVSRYNIAQQDSAQQFSFYHNTSSDDVIIDVPTQSPNIVMCRREGTTQAISSNGSAEQSETTAIDLTSITDFTIGAHVSDSDEWIGDIAEIIIYSSSLSASQINLVNTYLGNKWAVNVSQPTDVSEFKAWWDYGDSSTITETATRISQIDDKTVSGYDGTQPTGAWQPVSNTAAPNGKRSAFFNGGAYWMAANGATSLALADHTILIACKPLAQVGQTGILLGFQDTGATSADQEKWQVELTTGRLSHGDSGNNDLDTANLANTPTVLTLYGTAPQLSAYIDNVEGSLSPISNALPASCTSVSIGQEFDSVAIPSNWIRADIYEILIYGKILSASERLFLNNYLTDKWGI